MSDNVILRVQGLNLRFGGLAALADLNFDVRPGSITALVGPNGAGKSTAFNVISGFAKADSGEVGLAGQDITGLSPQAIVGRGLVRTFQMTKTFGGMSVLENMLVAGPSQVSERLTGALWRPRASRRRERELRVRATELLDTFRLAKQADAFAATLSVGQRKLLELARVLMADPKIILLDEPMAGVNPTLGEELFDYIEQLRRDRGLTCLFVEHDMGVVVRRSDRMIVMAQGSVIADGLPRDVVQDPRVLQAYLGTVAS